MIIKIKIADANIGFEDDTLITSGLGSCVAISLFDRSRKIGGLIHYMLPKQYANLKILNPYKYCDNGLKLLIEKMEMVGAKTFRMEAKICGGANMFSDLSGSEHETIGFRNVKMGREMLSKYKIPIIAQDVGSDYSRTIELYVKTGIVKITSYKFGEIYY